MVTESMTKTMLVQRLPGLEAFNGCPDSVMVMVSKTEKTDVQMKLVLKNSTDVLTADGDGIPDIDDKCPNTTWYLLSSTDVPDTDGDGVPDPDDQCPEEAGPAENNGCPWPDS